MDGNEEDSDGFPQMCNLIEVEIGRREKRPMCDTCRRPEAVCWCKSVEKREVRTSSRIILLQHPNEEKRCLRTSPILQILLPDGKYKEFKSKKFNITRFPELKDIVEDEATILLYPGTNASNIADLPRISQDRPAYNIIILDGTWQQAKSMYHASSCLKGIKQVQIHDERVSEYVIRTQPTQNALSTVETAAIVLSTLEDDPTIYQILVDPLKMICNFQISHGAVKHHSKELLIQSGGYGKPLGRRTYKKLKKSGGKEEDLDFKEWRSKYQKSSPSCCDFDGSPDDPLTLT